MRYQFVTVWALEAPLETVSDVISRSLNWPQWWRSVESVEELAPGDVTGVGNIRRYTWRGWLPYRLRFTMCVTQIEPQATIAGIASGDVNGWGRWSFAADGAVTIVRYDWQVRITSPWLRILAFIAGPLVRWNHNFVMHQGGQGLARVLNARLIRISHH